MKNYKVVTLLTLTATKWFVRKTAQFQSKIAQVEFLGFYSLERCIELV